jgi:hypothetical protein
MPPTFFELILLVFDFVFAFWPIILLAPIASRRNILPKMVTLWVFWAVVRVVLLFNPNPINASMVIPEPLSTYLFFAVGAILVVLLQLTKAVRARKNVQPRSRQR